MCRVKFKWKHCHETRKSSRTPWRPRRVAGHLASHLQPQAGGRCHQCIGRMQCPDQHPNRWLQGQWRSRRQWRTGQGSKRSPHRRMLPVVSPRWPRSKLLQFQCLWQAQTHESCEGQARRPWGMLRSTAARHRSWRGSEPSWQSEIMTGGDGLEVSGFTWAKQKKQTELIGASVSDSAVLPGMKSTGLHLCWCESLKSCTTRVTENDKQPWTRKSAFQFFFDASFAFRIESSAKKKCVMGPLTWWEGWQRGAPGQWQAWLMVPKCFKPFQIFSKHHKNSSQLHYSISKKMQCSNVQSKI